MAPESWDKINQVAGALHQNPIKKRRVDPRPGVSKGVRPLRGEYARGLAPSARVGVNGLPFVPTREGGSTPLPSTKNTHLS